MAVLADADDARKPVAVVPVTSHARARGIARTWLPAECKVLQRCRDVEKHLLAGGIETDTADRLRERNEEASEALRQHLLHTLDALSRISEILEP